MSDAPSANAQPWHGKIFIPKNKIQIKDNPEKKTLILHFAFQREGSEVIEQGQHFCFENKKFLRDKLDEAIAAETAIEVDIDPEQKFGKWNIKIPEPASKGGYGGGGGRPREPQPPYYRGKQLNQAQYLALYAQLYEINFQRMKDKFPKAMAEHTPAFAEMIRLQTSTDLAMIKENLWIPDALK